MDNCDFSQKRIILQGYEAEVQKINPMKMLFENQNPAVFYTTTNGVPQIQIPIKNQ